MTARRGTAIASTAVATAVAVVLATSGRAETARPSERTATPTATPTTSRLAARERPRGVVLDCSTQSGLGGAPGGTFTSRSNLVVGPLAMTAGAGATPGYSLDFGGNKFPLYVRGGHRVTVQVSGDARPGAGLVYGQLPANRPRLARTGYRVVTFIACRRDEMPPRNPRESTACCFSFWAGGVLAASPRCVPLLIWVDDELSPRRSVIHLGMRDCG